MREWLFALVPVVAVAYFLRFPDQLAVLLSDAAHFLR
jgi:hypothetical protein